MKRILLVLVLLALVSPLKAEGAVVAENSASLRERGENKTFDERFILLNSYLNSKNSPLAAVSGDFIEVADRYDLDWRLLPAIAGLESSFGKRLWPGSFNPFGWGGGYIVFKDWEDGFDKVAKGLKENYIRKGLTTPETIGKVYAPPNPKWGGLVASLMKQISKEE